MSATDRGTWRRISAKRTAELKAVIDEVMINNRSRCLDDDADRTVVADALLAALTRTGMI